MPLSFCHNRFIVLLESQINMARPMVKHMVDETPLIYEVRYLPVLLLVTQTHLTYVCNPFFPTPQCRCIPGNLCQENVLPIIEGQIGDGSSLSWLENVINGTKEKERFVIELYSNHSLLGWYLIYVYG